MASTAIKQFSAFDHVILGFGFVTGDAPTHIYSLLECGNSLFAHVTMTIFAVQTGGDMWAMIEMHKIRHLVNRNPVDGLVFLYILIELL